jgi:hypothetical protein
MKGVRDSQFPVRQGNINNLAMIKIKVNPDSPVSQFPD